MSRHLATLIKFSCFLFGLVSFSLVFFAHPVQASTVDLSGHWHVRLDPNDVGESEAWFGTVAGEPIRLPGTTGDAKLGEPLSLEPELTPQVFKHLHQRYRYIGAAWYSRSFEINQSNINQTLDLVLERVIWETTVWINGRKIGSQDSLSTAHRYSVGSALRAGTNTIVVRVDNRMKIDIGAIGHAYTEETQTIWNGVIGTIALVPRSPIKILTHPLRIAVEQPGDLQVQIKRIGSEEEAPIQWSNRLAAAGTVDVPVPANTVTTWSEFDPALYRVDCRLRTDQNGEHTANLVTGFRSVGADGRRLLINGKPSFMRGTLECCIFPKTGYPPTDRAGWDKVFGTLKQYGLNHIRFHSWCPPEAAFASADHHGVYVQAELPNWTFHMGQRPKTDAFLLEEGMRILRDYSHHPSFVLFSIGNEITGDFDYVDSMITKFRQRAPHILYTSTSYSFSPRGLLPGPNDDFFISQRTQTGWVRGQGFLNQTVPTTDSDYSEGLKCLQIPLITHEVGQYNVFPNLQEIPKYDGLLRAVNFEAIRDDLQSKGRLDEAESYTANSGALARVLYKEDIERALRTADLSGIQLLDLRDFPGQSTATVGLLDAFWDSKGLLSPAEFRRFCSPVVPLAHIAKRTWSHQETFLAKIEVANFSESALERQKIQWQIADEAGNVLFRDLISQVDIPIGNGNAITTLEVPLRSIGRASRLRLTVSIEGTDYANDWDIWVYPQTDEVAVAAEVVIVRQFGRPLFDALAAGRKVLFLPKREEIERPLDGRFVPVFWSPLHFPNQPGSLGAMIQSNHPVFENFPTSTHTDWQWWELLATSVSIDMSEAALAGGADKPSEAMQEASDCPLPIMQFIDKYNRNAVPAILWEAKVGPGSLMVCSLDLESAPDQRLVAKQLKQSVLQYMSSERFRPLQAMAPEKLASLFRYRPYQIRLEKGSTHPNHPISNLGDRNSKTICHTDWRDQNNRYPYHVIIDLNDAMTVNGMSIQQRTDSPNGVIADYQISISPDGQSWITVHRGTQPSGEIRLKDPVTARAIRFEALSANNGRNNFGLAELAPILNEENTGAEELGIVEGFNAPAKPKL